MRNYLSKFIIIFIFPIFIYAKGGHYIFVVDGSGSMSGVPLQQAKDAMMKLAKPLMLNGGKVAVVVGNTPCNSKPIIASKFVDNLQALKNIISQITTDTGDNITLGFKYAQNLMAQNDYDGHIWLIGDCDGLQHCKSIEKIAKEYESKNQLTPFTYLFVSGCTLEEKQAWKAMIKKISGAKAGSAATFDYNNIIKRVPQKIKLKKQYFKKYSFLNKDGSENSGDNYRNSPWRCIDSDGLKWLVINKKEQDIDFFMKEPKTNAFYQKNSKNLLIDDYIALLNRDKTCGVNTWRLPDIFELSRLTQMGPQLRNRLFPYLKIWPHITITAGNFNGFRKGIDFNNAQIYDYREDRPYAAIFVSGKIDTTLFTPPPAMLERLKVTKNTLSKPKQIDDMIDQVTFNTKNNVELNSIIESNEVTIKGINIPIKVKVINGEISINGSNWQSSEVKVKNGDKIKVRHTSSNNYESEVETTLIFASGIINASFKSITKKQTIKKIEKNQTSGGKKLKLEDLLN